MDGSPDRSVASLSDDEQSGGGIGLGKGGGFLGGGGGFSFARAGALVRPKGRYFQGRMVYCLPPGEGHDFAQSHRPEHYGIAPDPRCDHLPDLLNLLITHYHAHIGRGEKLWELEELWDRSTVFGLISCCGPRQWRHFCSPPPSGGFIAPTTSTILGS